MLHSEPFLKTSQPTEYQKAYKDCIHGLIKPSKLCSAYISTLEFQRLAFIKQLGNTSKVYPGANHTRFEHSLGVMHLAGKFAKKLKIPKQYCRLIELAGLMHDIGHLPYSHLFDELLFKLSATTVFAFPIRHEDRSVQIFRSISERLNILTNDEMEFVICCILGEKYSYFPPYYTQIISGNIDVDKLDYLARDAYHTDMIQISIGYILENLGVDNEGNLAFRRKAAVDLDIVFRIRENMHHLVYQHHRAIYFDNIYLWMMSQIWNKISDPQNIYEFELEYLLKNSPETSEVYKRMLTEIIDIETLPNIHKTLITFQSPSLNSLENIKWID